MAPAGTPAPVVARLSREIGKVMRDPAVVERVNAAGLDPVTGTPAELEALVQARHRALPAHHHAHRREARGALSRHCAARQPTARGPGWAVIEKFEHGRRECVRQLVGSGTMPPAAARALTAGDRSFFRRA